MLPNRRRGTSGHTDQDVDQTAGASPSTTPLTQPQAQTGRSNILRRPFTFGSSIVRTAPRGSASPRGPHEKKGSFGLTTLHPRYDDFHLSHDFEAHIVFVHGLGGGSESTWTKGKVLWPRDLLPLEDGYRNTGIHSFGYDSDFKASNILNIADFSNALLAGLEDDPLIQTSPCPIILIGHSMGGLVIKKSYIKAREAPRFKMLGQRIRSMCFIATPHQGSDLAATLSRLLRITPGGRPYLDDLNRNSEEIKIINEMFPRHSDDLALLSFYESRALSIPGIGKRLIVEKDNAVLGYENERSELLNGDHRSICKFDSPQDSNYIAIHRALRRIITLIAEGYLKNQVDVQTPQEDLSIIESFLELAYNQEQDLSRLVSERIEGTCEWLVENPVYDQWVNSSESSILWLRGPPGAGKTFLAGYAIDGIQHDLGKNACYYFFVQGDTSRDSLSSFLRSMASQLAQLIPEVRAFIIRILRQEPGLASSTDHRALWCKLWLRGILKLEVDRSSEVLWVIDSLDECSMDVELTNFLDRFREFAFIRIFVTARRAHDSYPIASKRVKTIDVRMEDTQIDIASYLNRRLPSSEPLLHNGILAKSNGCFLWATLVVCRLEGVHGLRARLRAIESEPPGMHDLYARIAFSLPNVQLSRSILIWVVEAVRPMSLGELHYVLPGLSEEDGDSAVKEMILRNCHDLVYIDQNSFVRLRHQSAREFLTHGDVIREDSGLAISSGGGHKLLAMDCLRCLTSSELSRSSQRRMIVSRRSTPFVLYATDFLYVHLSESPAQDQDLLEKLSAFLLSENLLTWVAYSARKGNLETVLRTAQALKYFLRPKSKTDRLLSNEVIVVDKWATDLVKLVSKFGRPLSSDPDSIFDLIPPFCPPQTAPFEQFARRPGGITVHGLSATTWDDCLCTVMPSSRNVTKPAGEHGRASPLSIGRRKLETAIKTESLKSVASTKRWFAIGTSLGRISIFNESTCLEENVVEHGMSVNLLKFATHKSILASASNRDIQIWNTRTWESVWTVKVPKECMEFAFVDDDQILLAALSNNTLLVLNLRDKAQSTIEWVKRLEQRFGGKFKARFPQTATFNVDLDTLAIVYRAQDIVLWNYEDNSYTLYSHDNGLSDGTAEPMASVNSLVFSQSPGSSLLVASYNLGDLVLFDVRERSLKAKLSQVRIYFRLSCSPDGRTFAGAANDGTIELYDFETLRMVYRIRSEDQGITTLAFNHDSPRLYDIRGDRRSCRVWEPAALLRRDIENELLRSPSIYSQDSQAGVVDIQDPRTSMVTALAPYRQGMYFVGKDDASVSLFERDTGLALTVLFSHISSVVKLVYHEQASMLMSVDTAGYLMAHSIDQAEGQWYAQTRLTHHNPGSGIQQFLCNHEGTLILICAKDQASIFSLVDGRSLGASVSCNPVIAYAWAPHPMKSDQLLLAYHDKIYIYSWKDLSALTEGGITLAEELKPEMRIRRVVPMFAGTVLALSYSNRGPRAKPEIFAIPATSLEPASDDIHSINTYQNVYDQIEYHIGSLRNREVFLSTSGWVCSASEDAFRGLVGVSYHFVPPADWLRTSDELIIRLTDTGDVLFAWRGEVAVVSGGLDREHDLKRRKRV